MRLTGDDMYDLISEALKEKGAAVGKDDIVRGAGYGLGGVSGLAASGEMAVSNINGLLQKMATDAVEKFGLKTAASKSTSQLVFHTHVW